MGMFYSQPVYFNVILINADYDKIEIDGFTKQNNYSLTYTTEKGTTIADFLNNVNKFREIPIKKLKYKGRHFLPTETIENNCIMYISI